MCGICLKSTVTLAPVVLKHVSETYFGLSLNHFELVRQMIMEHGTFLASGACWSSLLHSPPTQLHLHSSVSRRSANFAALKQSKAIACVLCPVVRQWEVELHGRGDAELGPRHGTPPCTRGFSPNLQ